MSIIVGFKTDRAEESWNILSEKNLAKLGLSTPQLAEMSMTTSFCIPGNLYTEPNVASSLHPCAGSICVSLVGPDNRQYEIHDIFYYDHNIAGKHADGLPHWNHERRFVINGCVLGRIKEVECHTIDDSNKIELFLIDGVGKKRLEGVYRPDKGTICKLDI